MGCERHTSIGTGVWGLLTLLTLYGYKKASTHLEEALVNGMKVEALSKENRGRPSLNSMAF